MHEAIHQEGGPGQIPGILHDGEHEIKEKDDRQEAHHRAHAEPNPVHQEIAQHLRGSQALEQGQQQLIPQSVKQTHHQLLQGGPQDIDGLEHHQHNRQEQQGAHQWMEQQPIKAAAVGAQNLLRFSHETFHQLPAMGFQPVVIAEGELPEEGRPCPLGRPAGEVDGGQQSGDALIASSTHRQHRQGQGLRQTPMVDPHAEAPGFIAHVEGQQGRHTRFPQLQHEPELPGHLGGVHHQHHQVRGRLAQKPLHDRLVFTAAGEVVHTGQIDQLEGVSIGVGGQAAPQEIHREPRPVAHLGMAAREPVEEGRFARVRHAQQGHHGGSGGVHGPGPGRMGGIAMV